MSSTPPPRQTSARTPIQQNPQHRTKWLFLSLWLFRISNALLVKTFFQPDEFFQALEPAWRSTFGPASNAWITWEWHEALRSSIHPLLFSMCYKGAAAFGHWLKASPRIRAEILILAPKVLQAAFAAATDLFTYRFACRLYGWGSRTSLVAMALSLLSPWNWFASTRTFSNSLETTLTIVAISFWPWEWFLHDGEDGTKGNVSSKDAKVSQQSNSDERETSAPEDLTISLGAAALACILRPTNILIWATITLVLILRGIGASKTFQLASAAFFCGGTVLATSAAMDRHFYGEWVLPPLKFLQFNVIQSLAMFYGSNRVDYYFTEGLPLLLTTALPSAAIGVWNALRSYIDPPKGQDGKIATIESILARAVMTTVLALTLISHKEVRFLFPLLPILHILATKPLVACFELDSKSLKPNKLALLALGILINIGIAVYTSHFHQRGVMEVMHYLRHEYETKYMLSNAQAEMTVGFLMPCHSTPWRSHLVYPDINAWALTCEPPLHLTLQQRDGYMDEADVFYADPITWIEHNMQNLGIRNDGSLIGGLATGAEVRREWPRYLVFFEQLLPLLEKQLEGSKYEECWREFNSHWHDDWRRKGDVVVWCSP